MKKTIIFVISVFLLFTFAFNVSADTLLYSENWNSATADGYTKFLTSGSNANFGSNDYRSSDTTTSGYVKNYNLSFDILNVSFDYVCASNCNYIVVGLTNRITDGSQIYCGDVEFAPYNAGTWYFFRNDSSEATGGWTRPSFPFTSSIIFNSNGTVSYYDENGLIASTNYGQLDSYTNLCILSRDSTDAIDNIELWEMGIVGNISDTTSPTISNIIQTPNNLTSLNALITGIEINASITDTSGINNSKTYINFTPTDIEIFVNGTAISTQVNIYNFTNQSNIYSWNLDERYYLSSTNNFEYNVFETVLQEYVLTGQNRWLKTEFFNVSNNAPQVFVEYNSQNNTGVPSTSEYYYCNFDYNETKGNPISHNNCTLFHSRLNNAGFNHSHGGDSEHIIAPMNINITSGTLNGVYVTPISYILKRGTVTGDIIRYLNQTVRTGANEISTNLGNTWTEFDPMLTGATIDSHIHQLHYNETIFYSICSSDLSVNENPICSITYNDTIDFVIFPPNAVQIFNPVTNSYNGTINISHSVSGSSSGLEITDYKYEYTVSGVDSYELIILNNYPDTSYTWDITNIINGEYVLKITVEDNLNQTVESFSEIFTINNPESLNTQYLSSINNTLLNILEVVALLGAYGLFAVSIFLQIRDLERFYVIFNLILQAAIGVLFWTSGVYIMTYVSLILVVINSISLFE